MTLLIDNRGRWPGINRKFHPGLLRYVKSSKFAILWGTAEFVWSGRITKYF